MWATITAQCSFISLHRDRLPLEEQKTVLMSSCLVERVW